VEIVFFPKLLFFLHKRSLVTGINRVRRLPANSFFVYIHAFLIITRTLSHEIWSTPTGNIWLIDFSIAKKEKKDSQNRHRVTFDANVSICTYNFLNYRRLSLSYFPLYRSLYRSFLYILPRRVDIYTGAAWFDKQVKLAFCVVTCRRRQYKQLWRKMITPGAMR
jgi:hypothetical protein